MSMLWWRYPRWAGRLMTAWFLLSLVTGPVVSVHVSSGSSRTSILARLIGWAFSAFLAWRVTCGGRISRMLLILADASALIAAVMGLAVQFRLAELGLLALLAAQVALLLSPAVYRRTRPAAQPGATVALWRRRTPAPLVAALVGGAALGLIGMAVSTAVINSRVRDYNDETLHVRAGHPAGAILSPGRYEVLAGCGWDWGCDLFEPRNVLIQGALSGPVAAILDRGGERDIGDQQFFQSMAFTIPVRELVEVALNGHFRAPALIVPAQDKADMIRRWKVSEAGFGLLLLGSLAVLAWPVRRSVAGGW